VREDQSKTPGVMAEMIKADKQAVGTIIQYRAKVS